MEIQKNGDDFLSTNERYLWEFVWATMLRFGSPILFKQMGPVMIPNMKQDTVVQFFVSSASPRKADIIEWIKQEFDGEVKDGKMMEVNNEQFYSPGFKYMILEYSGAMGYVERTQMQALATGFLVEMRQRLNELGNVKMRKQARKQAEERQGIMPMKENE